MTDSWVNIYLYHGEPDGNSFGKVANRERRHQSVPRLTHCLGPAGFRFGPHQSLWAGPVG